MSDTKKITYWQQLQDPRWQKKRLEILSRDEWMCQACQATESQLQVHHKEYWKGTMPWEYPNEVFVTLCENCHSEITCLGNQIKAELHFFPAFEMFKTCMKSVAEGDWYDFSIAVSLLKRNPKEVQRLVKKYVQKQP